MTKQQELDILDATIATLGQQSYLGPWLAEYRGQIEQDIRSDFEPSSPMPGAAYRQALDIRTAAVAEATAIMDRTTKQAAELVQRAHTRIEQARTQARRELERIAATL